MNIANFSSLAFKSFSDVSKKITQQNTDKKAKKMAPIMFDLANENMSSDFLQEFAMKMKAMA